MAILNVPERGQPLDVSTISQIVNAINTLSTSVTSSTYKYVTVDTQGAGKQSVKTSDAKIIGGYKISSKLIRNCEMLRYP